MADWQCERRARDGLGVERKDRLMAAKVAKRDIAEATGRVGDVAQT
jgi:hypothetical protein